MIRVTRRGWAVVFAAAFLFGAFFPWDSLWWNR